MNIKASEIYKTAKDALVYYGYSELEYIFPHLYSCIFVQ